MREIAIPYSPRDVQRRIHAALDNHRFAVVVAHRRLGKTVLAINHLIRAALTCRKKRPRFAYVAPTFRMAKAIAFDYLAYYSKSIPGTQVNISELRVDFVNGGQVRLYGGDNPDSLRGIYLDGVVVDEYGMMSGDLFSMVLRPALADREGWAMFLGTPNGKNQFYELYQHAKGSEGWAALMHRASETGILRPAELEAARAVMTADEYAQEFECSFDAAVKGAIFAAELQEAREDERITGVPYEPLLPVDTAWDLGVGDATAIWFSQTTRGGEVRLIDYYEAQGEGLPHYASVLQQKGYTYGRHVAPHDIAVRELASGRSRWETAASLGINFEVAPKVPYEDGIHAARMLFPRCWFDAKKCNPGLEMLAAYRRDYNSRIKEFTSRPVHDHASHAADAFRYLAVSQKGHQVKPDTSDYWPDSGGSWMDT